MLKETQSKHIANDPLFLKRLFHERVYVIESNSDTFSKSEKKLSTSSTLKKTKYSLCIISVSDEFLSSEERSFLQKVYESCGIKADEVLMTNRNLSSSNDLNAYITELSCKIMLFFGESSTLSGAAEMFKKYDVFEQGGTQIIIVDHVSQVMADQSLKKKLWTVLQEVFQINSAK